MKQNDLLAHALRKRFRDSGVSVVGLVSSPGSGKTAFLEKILGGLAGDFRVAALVGDLATENDAARLKRATPDVRQITTGTICHLDAQMIERALDGWQLDTLDFPLLKTSAISSALPAMISAKNSASSCSPRPKAKTSL
jgi:hydrogenase nickel incorporation protein HypB